MLTIHFDGDLRFSCFESHSISLVQSYSMAAGSSIHTHTDRLCLDFKSVKARDPLLTLDILISSGEGLRSDQTFLKVQPTSSQDVCDILSACTTTTLTVDRRWDFSSVL